MNGELISYIVVLFVGALSCAFLYFKHKFSYWKKKGIPFEEPVIPFGSINKLSHRNLPFVDRVDSIYKNGQKVNAKVFGMYTFTRPDVLILDTDLLKRVMVKDFSSFHDRGITSNEENDPLTAHLITAEGEKWKNLRSYFSPAFTSGKLKSMFNIMADCTKGLKKCVDENISQGKPMEMKDLCGRYTTDIIGSCAFGVEINSLENPDTEFRKYATRLTDQTFFEQLMALFIFTFPKLTKALKLRIFPEDVTQFFLNLVKDVVSLRKASHIERNDIMQNIMELMDKGKIEGSNLPPGKKLSLNEAAAQAFVFFVAGFDTSSSAMMFCMYEMSRQPDLQNRLRREILDVLRKNNNQLSYEAITEMKYLDQVISETLRVYPSAPVTTRGANETYFVPEIGGNIEKGSLVFIPIYSIHHDPKYFEEPEKFDPERFNDDNKSKIKEFSYLPFGDGPRHCIGKRFALLKTKIGIVSLLSQYKFTLNPKTKTPIRFDKSSSNLTACGGIWLDAEQL